MHVDTKRRKTTAAGGGGISIEAVQEVIAAYPNDHYVDQFVRLAGVTTQEDFDVAWGAPENRPIIHLLMNAKTEQRRSLLPSRAPGVLEASLRNFFVLPVDGFIVEGTPLAEQVPFDFGTHERFLADTEAHPIQTWIAWYQSLKSGAIPMQINAHALRGRIVLVLMGINSVDALVQLYDKTTCRPKRQGAGYVGVLRMMGVSEADLPMGILSTDESVDADHRIDEAWIRTQLQRGGPMVIYALANAKQIGDIAKWLEGHLDRVHIILDEAHGMFPLTKLHSDDMGKQAATTLRNVLWRRVGGALERRVQGFTMVSATAFDLQAMSDDLQEKPWQRVADDDRLARMGYFGVDDVRGFPGIVPNDVDDEVRGAYLSFGLKDMVMKFSFGRDWQEQLYRSVEVIKTKVNADGEPTVETLIERRRFSDADFLTAVTRAHVHPVVDAFFAGFEQTEGAFMLESTTRHKEAIRNCGVLCQATVKMYPGVQSISLCGGGSKVALYRKEGDEVKCREFEDLRAAYLAAVDYDSRMPIHVCSNNVGGSVTLIRRDMDRAITHIIPGGIVKGDTDINVVAQTLGRVCHYRRDNLRLLYDDDHEPYALMLGGAGDLDIMQGYRPLCQFGAANIDVNGGIRHGTFPSSLAPFKFHRVGHARSNTTARLLGASFVPRNEGSLRQLAGRVADRTLQRSLRAQVQQEDEQQQQEEEEDQQDQQQQQEEELERTELNDELLRVGEDDHVDNAQLIDFVLERQKDIPGLDLWKDRYGGSVPPIARVAQVITVPAGRTVKQAVLEEQENLLNSGAGSSSSSAPPAADVRRWSVTKWNATTTYGPTDIPYVDNPDVSSVVVALLRADRPAAVDGTMPPLPYIDLRFNGSDDGGDVVDTIVIELVERSTIDEHVDVATALRELCGMLGSGWEGTTASFNRQLKERMPETYAAIQRQRGEVKNKTMVIGTYHLQNLVKNGVVEPMSIGNCRGWKVLGAAAQE